MIALVIRRTLWGLGVMLVVAIASFLLTFVAPADPARAIGGPRASAEAIERIRASLGLDRHPLDQLLGHLAALAQGDLGVSYQMGGVRVLDIILARLPATATLALSSVLLALVVGGVIGIIVARSPGGRTDRLSGVTSALLLALPIFLVGPLLLYAFAFWPLVEHGIELFPLAAGSFDPLDVRALTLPCLTLTLALVPFYIRVTRTTMRDELEQDYVRTARAKGLAEHLVIRRHPFRNALPVLTTQVALDLGLILGGVVVVERVFGWPGIGELAVSAITREDLPLLIGTLLVATGFIVVANVVADIVNAVLDPRVTAA